MKDVTKDCLSGLVLLLFAMVFFFESLKFMFWEETFGPSEGFFPSVLSVVMALISIIIIGRALLHAKKDHGLSAVFGPKKNKFFMYFGSSMIFALIFVKVGYSLALSSFLIFILKFVERQSWKIAFAVTIVSIVLSYLLFFGLFSVTFPEGFLTPVAERLLYR